MKVKSKFSGNKHLMYTSGWHHRVLFEFEGFELLDTTDENGVNRYIVAKNIVNQTEYYELDFKDFYELIVLYLGGRKELFLMHRLLEELMEMEESSYIKGTDSYREADIRNG